MTSMMVTRLSSMTGITFDNQRGISMVEILVAVTISLVLMAGISQIFLSSKTSYNLQDGLGRLQENARYALDTLNRSIGMAGYTENITPLAAFDTTTTANNATVNTDLGFTLSNGKASDIIEVVYTSATDCLGNATGGQASDRFYIDGSNLMCLGNGNVTPGIMAEGVENMQILYGEDTNNDKIANVYVNKDNVVNWNDIVSVRVALLVSTVQSVGSNTTDDKTHVLLNAAPIGPIGDNVIRRVYTRTIILRNVNT